jgi:mycofactocin system creatininase family protein
VGVALDLASMRWTDVGAGWLLAVALGSCEQHGPHLPLGTDTSIAGALADGLARRRPGVVVGPAVAYGASGEHAGFAGTLSIGTAALSLLVVELVRSADAFAGVVLVSGHGGNAEALGTATATLSGEGRRVLAWSPSAATATAAGGRDADAHAGWVETSVALALDARSVALDAAEAGERRPLAAVIGALRSGGVGSVSPNGVLGDPAGSSAAVGSAVLGAWTADLVDAVDRWAACP